ncbi:hypothetical protein [Enterobacter hormaechei]|uniref:hypothetical protein n=1 Tax=Enterobacter cloacae complex TaxID=354276 RepID=UPI003A987ADC
MKKIIIALFFAPFFTHATTDAECLSKPAFDGTLSNVWKEGDSRYANFENCIYELSGIGIGYDNDTSWNGHWTPVRAADGSGNGGDDNSSGGGSNGDSGNNSTPDTVTPGQTVNLPSDLSTLSIPANVVKSDSIGSQFSLYTNASCTMCSGYYLSNNADSIAIANITETVKADYNQPDMWFEQTDSDGNHVKILQNSYKAVSYNVESKQSDVNNPTYINYSYSVNVKQVSYDTSNVCIMNWETFQNKCDASRAVLITDTVTPSYSRNITIQSNINYQGSNGSGGSGNDGGGTGNNGNGTGDFDYVKMANANKDALTESFDLSALQADTGASLDGSVQGTLDSLSGFSDSIGGLVGNGSAISGEFAGSSAAMNAIGEGDKSPLLDSFLKDGLFPALPEFKQCTPFVFAPGKEYEFIIECKYIDMFKGIFAFILYFWTFVTVYDSFSGILRKGRG